MTFLALKFSSKVKNFFLAVHTPQCFLQSLFCVKCFIHWKRLQLYVRFDILNAAGDKKMTLPSPTIVLSKFVFQTRSELFGLVQDERPRFGSLYKFWSEPRWEIKKTLREDFLCRNNSKWWRQYESCCKSQFPATAKVLFRRVASRSVTLTT